MCMSALPIIGVTLAVNITTTLVNMKIQRKSLEVGASLSGLTYSMLSGIQKVKLTGSEKRIFARWAGSYKTSANYTYNPPFLLKYTEAISTAITAIGTVVIYFTSIMSGGIEVQNLTFRYDEGGRNVLDGINIKIRRGKYVAIVGKTGCGKSMLIRLLLGFENLKAYNDVACYRCRRNVKLLK